MAGNGLVYADAVNWVYDTLKAAAGVAPLANVQAKHVYLGNHRKFSDKREGLPGIIIRLQDPAIDENWGEISNSMRDGNLEIIVSFAIVPDDYDDYVYGGTGKNGLLTLGAQIMNVLDDADPLARLGGNARDANLTMGLTSASDDRYVGHVIVRATILFAMGGR